MTVALTGRTLKLDDLVRVSRGREQVELAAGASARMRAQRKIVEDAVRDGATAYGVTTGLGMRRDALVQADDAAAFNRSAIAGHRVGLGPPASEDVVRAALLCMANGLAGGFPGARTELAQAVVDALNAGSLPVVHSLGSLGQADLAQNADLAAGLLDGLALEAGEAAALLVSNSFSTAQAALAIADAGSLLRWCDLAAALDYEAFGANLDALHEEIGDARPFPGVRETLHRMRSLLEGSALWEPDGARFIHDPLTYRCLPQIHGSTRDAFHFVEGQLAVELNAHQGNPLVVSHERRLVSVGNFDALPLAAALDFARIALAPIFASAVERTLKLLSPPFSELAEGLVEQTGTWEDGLSELGVAAQAIAAEARLLAQPTSFELVSTMQESGVEDRAALASLGARRLGEMVALGSRVVAIELVVAAQALDLRTSGQLGLGAASALTFVRERVPFVRSTASMPLPLEELATEIRSGPAPA